MIEETIEKIRPLDQKMMQQALERQATLTKPQGSLGRLEEISVRLAGMTGELSVDLTRKAVFVMAGDHGIATAGVSAFPQAVTAQMVLNFLHGGAAINVLARHAGARVIVTDMGVATKLPDHPELLVKKIAAGTANMAEGPAMTRDQARAAIGAGIEIVTAEIEKGLDIVGTGDMGIGNTTPSAAICAVITGNAVVDVTGRGTGIDDEKLAFKVKMIEQAIAVNRPKPDDALDVLAKVGGFEIGGLAGVIIGAASHRRPVVIDGFISGAAALIAMTMAPQVKDYLIAGHQSVEPGHQLMLEHLGLEPLLNLDLRLGEGTGAVLAMQIVEASARIIKEMATFAEAGVADKE